jgi:hypothetical protein
MMRAVFNKIRSRTTFAALTIALLVILGDSRPAIGDEADEQRLQKYTVELKEHEVADSRKAATSELGKAEALRDKARSLMQKRKNRDELARTLDELEATVSLIGAKIVHAEAKAKHDGQKNKLGELRAELEKVQTEAEKLEKRLGGGK